MDVRSVSYANLQKICKDLKVEGLHNQPCNQKKEALIVLLEPLLKVSSVKKRISPSKQEFIQTKPSFKLVKQINKTTFIASATTSTDVVSVATTSPSHLLDFPSLKLGVIFHWGLYSVPAFHQYPKKPKIMNGSEWYLRRLKNPFSYGYESLNHHYATWPKILNISSDPKQNTANHHGYYRFKTMFEAAANNWNANDWLTLVNKSGAKYLIITVKHHDGFSLYPSQVRSRDMCTDRDYINEIADACRRYDIHFGVYYSLYEIGATAYKKANPEPYVTGVMIPQIMEIVDRYRPKIFWSDGDWEQTPKAWHSRQIVDWLHSKGVIVNDRWGKETAATQNNSQDEYSDFKDVEDRWMPATKPLFDWEHIVPIAKGWAYNLLHTDYDFKSPVEIKCLKKKVNAMGGNLLLGLGPDASGDLDRREIMVLENL
jgi:alpha-L-fucosidase